MPEQRKHLRLPVETRTFIELVSARVGEDDSGRLVTCRTENISRGGLQVTLEEAVTVGAILQIGVELPGANSPLYLAGEVRWCRPNEGDPDQPYSAGFKLLNSEGSDLQRWVELLSSMED